mgnify:CR=1 FL=1
MKKQAHVLAGRLLVKRDKGDTTTESGLIEIPSLYAEKKKSGTVVLVGESTNSVKMEVKVGDTVLFSDDAGSEITINDQFKSVPEGYYLILPQGDVLIYTRESKIK